MLKQISLITIACLSLATASTIYTSKSSAQTIPKAQCLSQYGETKCGYNCIAQYGEIKCSDWPGGVCQAQYGEIKCGPPAPINWFDAYVNRSSNSTTSNSGIRGAWAVRSGSGRWNGILRMRGDVGTLIYVSDSAEVIELKMELKHNSDNEYMLEGKFLTYHNLKQNHSPPKYYFERFEKNFLAKTCRDCRPTTFTYIGD